MKRDMDMVRDLLLKVEDGQKVFETASSEDAELLGFEPDTVLSQEDADKIAGHLILLEEADFIVVEGRMGGGSVLVDRLTWRGHEFLDTIRDDEVWAQTKQTAKKAGTGAIEFVWGIAKEIAKAEVKRRTGFDVG